MGVLTTGTLILGTRPSQLARWQTGFIVELLQAHWPELQFDTVLFTTQGDRSLDRPLPEIGGKGVFTEELEQALRSREIDLAVHSLKDLPVDEPAQLTIGAISPRADAHDVLVSPAGWTLGSLPAGARLGTSSLRRSAQVLALRPDLVLQSIRGNVDTRIRKAVQGDYEAIILAAAGIERLGLQAHVTEILPYEVMLPAPGQGALAVQCRAEEAPIRALLAPIEDTPTRLAVTAERAFLKSLGGGCSAPIAAYATYQEGRLHLDGLVAAVDGSRVVRVSGEGQDPHQLGGELADQALAQGAGGLL